MADITSPPFAHSRRAERPPCAFSLSSTRSRLWFPLSENPAPGSGLPPRAMASVDFFLLRYRNHVIPPPLLFFLHDGSRLPYDRLSFCAYTASTKPFAPPPAPPFFFSLGSVLRQVLFPLPLLLPPRRPLEGRLLGESPARR